MISRSTASALGDVYEQAFTRYFYPHAKPGETFAYAPGSEPPRTYKVDGSALYDFLFENEYPAWFCNLARSLDSSQSERRALKEFVMKLHTGETLYGDFPAWSENEREELGQQYLQDLAQDMLAEHEALLYGLALLTRDRSEQALADGLRKLLGRLELDGYAYEDERLLAPERDVLDVREEIGALESLYLALELDNRETAFDCLARSEEHYVAERWEDSISNSRKFLESVLREVASAYSQRVSGNALPSGTYTRPVRVRDYLEREGLLETKEKEALASVYGLLSNTGSHPYMAQKDQARLLRQLALPFSQFAMLRLQGAVNE